MNIVRPATSDRSPLPQGMGNYGFNEYHCPVTLDLDAIVQSRFGDKKIPKPLLRWLKQRT